MNKKVSLVVGGVLLGLAALAVLCCVAVFLFGAASPDPELLSITRLAPTVRVEAVSANPTPIPTEPPASPTLPANPTPTAEIPPGIPGLEHGGLRLKLKDIGFECQPIDSVQSGGQTVTISGCRKQAGEAMMGIDTASRNPNDLDQIKAYVVFSGEPNPAIAGEFLGMIAGLPYEGSDPAAAQAWVKENLAAIQGETDIRTAWFGPVHFELSGSAQARNLRVGSYLGMTDGEQ